MRIVISPPLDEPPPPQPFLSDFSHLLKAHRRVAVNKCRHWPVLVWIVTVSLVLGLGGLFVYLGLLAYRSLLSVGPQLGGGVLAITSLASVIAQVLFGISSAFVTLYMSEDLEILFASPVSIRAVFAVKSVVIALSNFLPVLFLAILPGIFYGLLFKAGVSFYLILLLVVISLWILGTALAVFLNLFIMRIVPPHRSKEAVGVIGAIAGIVIALLFQIPNIMLQTQGEIDFADFITRNEGVFRTSLYFPWGWGSRALVSGISGDMIPALGWSALLLLSAVGLFAVSFTLLERGFRQGWISVTQQPARRREKRRKPAVPAPAQGHAQTPVHMSSGTAIAGKAGEANANMTDAVRAVPEVAAESGAASGMAVASPMASRTMSAGWAVAGDNAATAPVWNGMWAIAKKDLLYLVRDTREWFGYLTPLIFMAFFVGQHLIMRTDSTRGTLVTVWFMYTLMFSGNIALQSFGREGEADWILRSVPLAGAPVVLGKLMACVLPTLVLMEALLVGTAVAIRLPARTTLMFAVGAVFLSLGSSSIGLFYSATSARYNPDNPQQRVAPGASLIMYLINLVFVILLALCLLYLFPPEEILAGAPNLTKVDPPGGFLGVLFVLVRFAAKPLLWAKPLRILYGIFVTGGIWAVFFFGFLTATIRQAKKGVHIEPVVVTKKKKKQARSKGASET